MTREEILKVKENRVHKITNSIGVYDCYKWLRKRKWVDTKMCLTEYQFYKIIREINTYVSEQLSLGNEFKIPYQMGSLEIRKINSYVNIKNNKIHTNLPIDWNRTLKLWCEDSDSYNNKTIVRQNEKYYYKVYYNKSKAAYKNKMFYQFRPCRTLKQKLKENINDNKVVDAFLLNKKQQYELE